MNQSEFNVAPYDPLRSYTDPERRGHCVAVDAGFSGLLISVQK